MVVLLFYAVTKYSLVDTGFFLRYLIELTQ